MTREEQIAAARRIAEDNEGWTWEHGGQALAHSQGTYIFLSWRTDRWYPVRAGHTSDKSHDSPAAAIRALGFTIHVRETS